MDKIHLSYILQLSMMILALFIITTSQVRAQQGQDSHGLTPEQVKQFCRLDNPRLNFVNHTESEICGLPESTPSTPTSNSSGSSPSSSGSSRRHQYPRRHQGHPRRHQGHPRRHQGQ